MRWLGLRSLVFHMDSLQDVFRIVVSWIDVYKTGSGYRYFGNRIIH